MEWINELFNTHSALQTLVLLSLIIAVGLALGRIRIKGISLGVAFVFFVGILAGHFNLSADHGMLDFAETFGLSLFVYTLGPTYRPSVYVFLSAKAPQSVLAARPMGPVCVKQGDRSPGV